MKTYEIKEVKTKEQLKELYDNWAMTWEGLRPQDFQLACAECGTKDTIGYVIKGKTMNELCGLTGDNAYNDELNIFAIHPYHGLAMMYGARWLTDIIDNNGARQRKWPF